MTDLVSLGSAVRHARVRFNLSQAELGALVGVMHTTVSSWELGKSAPKAAYLPVLARVLDLPLGRLIELREEVTVSTTWYKAMGPSPWSNAQRSAAVRQLRASEPERWANSIAEASNRVWTAESRAKASASARARRAKNADDFVKRSMAAKRRWARESKGGQVPPILQAAAQEKKARTHCRHGHAYTEENTVIVQKDGTTYRQCRECQRANARRYRSRRQSTSRVRSGGSANLMFKRFVFEEFVDEQWEDYNLTVDELARFDSRILYAAFNRAAARSHYRKPLTNRKEIVEGLVEDGEVKAPEPGECAFVNRQLDYCRSPSEIVIKIGSGYEGGVGACHKHIAPILLAAMGSTRAQNEPDQVREVYPGWMWGMMSHN